MSIIEESDKEIEQRLLSDVESEVDEVLDFLTKHQEIVSQFNTRLIIISTLHPTITIRKKATKLLSLDHKKDELKQLKSHLSFFHLIDEEEEMNESNQDYFSNAFQQFLLYRTVYEPLLLNSSLYASIYLEAANLFVNINHSIAESLVEAYLDVHQNDENAIILFSRILQEKTQYNDSIKLLSKVIKHNPNSYQGHLELGFVYEEFKENYKAAKKHYKRAAAINPDGVIVLIRLAYLNYYFLNKLEESKSYIDSILNIDPHNQYALTILGRIHWEVKGKYTLALNTFLKGLNGSKFHNSFLLSSLAEFYTEALGNHDKGKTFYEQALDIEPENRDNLVNYMVLVKQFYNDYGRMKHYYEQYLAQNPLDVDILMEYCLLILNYINDIKLARKQLKKVLAIQPKHIIAKALLEEVSG